MGRSFASIFLTLVNRAELAERILHLSLPHQVYSKMRFIVFLALVFVGATIFAAASAQRDVMIALKPRNVQALENVLYDVSNPESPNYGKYLTAEEAAAIVSPSSEDIQRIVDWLKVHLKADKVIVSRGRDFIRASLPDRSADIVLDHLHTPRSVISRLKTNSRVQLSSLEAEHVLELKSLIALAWDVSITKEDEHLDVSRDSNAGDLSIRRRYKPATTLAPLVSASPSNQKKSYQMPIDLVASSGKNNTQMVWGPGTYGYLQSDLKTYYSEFKVPAKTSDVSTYGYQGVPGGDNFGEATLDVQLITGLAPGVRTYVANTNTSRSTEEGLGFGYAFLDFVQTLASQPQIPNVLSLSLGSLSSDSCEILCQEVQKSGYTEQQCVKYMNEQRQVCMMDSGDQEDLISIAFMKLGARGMTIVAASGDGGSHYSFQPFPDSGIGHALNKVSCALNFPTFPAASPYVTAIGGTQWNNGDISQPVGWSASGGGFSWRYPVPAYQTVAVNAYLKANSGSQGFPPANAFNGTNRAYPDLAALADNVPMVIQGSTVAAGGTSASAPAWGGIFSMLNDQRLTKGLPALGFVNPRLYQIAASNPGEAFYDVTDGNSACSSDGSCCSTGFPAAQGFDPVTGLGSPLWTGLIKYLLN